MFKLFSFIQPKTKVKKHEKVCNNHDYFAEMPNKYNKILKSNHGDKSLKAPFMIYADLKCLLGNMYLCQNNPEKSYTEKKISIRLLAIHCLQSFYLMQQKISLIVTEAKIVSKGFVKT